MITINGKKIEVNHFPDGTQMLMDIPMEDICLRNYSGTSPSFTLKYVWRYEGDEELITLWYLRRHMSEALKEITYHRVAHELTMPYIPNARMDRTKNRKECFTLKYFCEMINAMNFDSVYVFDPHSNVSTALIDNLVKIDPIIPISTALRCVELKNDLKSEDIVIYFPDEGAYKRYSELFNETNGRCVLRKYMNNMFIYGMKKREWQTGQITGLSIRLSSGCPLPVNSLNEKTVLMIDDIISYGGTLAYSVDELRKLGAKKVYAYASHVENSVMDEEKGTLLKRYKEGKLNGVFTTNSIYTLPTKGDNNDCADKYNMVTYVYNF